MTVYDNDEIDLRPYLQALVRRWGYLAIFAVVGALAGLLVSWLPAETYEATAICLLTKQTNKLSLTSQLSTVADPTNTQTRADSIITIANSDAVAFQVMTAMQDQLPDDMTLADFAGNITIETVGDTILIKALAEEAGLAETIANTWAQVMVEAVNLAYSGEQPLSIVETQGQTAKADYETVQAELESFLETSQIEALQQQLDELNVLLYNGQTNDRLALFEYHRTRKNEMLAVQIQGQALKTLLQQGNQSAAGDLGDALAVFLARASTLSLTVNFQNQVKNSSLPQANVSAYQQEFSAFNRSDTPAIFLQINDLEALRDTSANYLADVESIIELAQAEQAKAEAALETLSLSILNGESAAVLGDTFDQIRQVKSQLEREQATYRQLIQARDLAWSAYQALSAKETEIKNAPKSSNYIVLISQAMRPVEPVARGTLLKVAVGTAGGFFIVALFIILRVWWVSANLINDKPVSTEQSG